MQFSLSARTVNVVVNTPAFQSGHPGSNPAGGIYFIVFVDFIYLYFFFSFIMWFIFIRVCNFVTRLAKHSSQKFDINTRNIQRGIFCCNLWWFIGVCNKAVEAYWLAIGRVWCVFSLSSFCLLVSVKIWSFLALRHRAKFIGGMGPVQKAMGRTLLYCFKAWGGYFFLQSPTMGRIHFSTTLKPMRRYLQKKMQLELYFSLK